MPDVATIPQGEQAAVDAVARFLQTRGDAPADPPVPAPVAEQEEVEPEVSDQIDGEPAEADQPDAEVQGDEPEVESEEAPDQEADDSEDFVMPASIEEFADMTETTVDDLLDSMTIKTKVRGQFQDVPLSELKAGWQKGADYELRVAQQRQEYDADRKREKERSEQHQQSLAYLGHSIMEYQNLLGELTEDFVDSVRSSHGDDAARLVNQIRRRLTSATEKSTEQYQLQVRQYGEGQQKAAQEAMQSNTQSFINAHPEMADNKKAAAKMNDLSQYLLARGMEADAIKGLWSTPGADVTVSLMLEAMDASAIKEQTKVVKRKIKGLSRKQVKPGATKTEGMKKARQKRGVADLVNQASANPKDTQLQREAGVAAVRQYMESR